MFKCPKCNREFNPEDDSYCFNCGECLTNFCSNDDCVRNEEGNEDIMGLPHDACFCNYCGSKSDFYLKGFITIAEHFD